MYPLVFRQTWKPNLAEAVSKVRNPYLNVILSPRNCINKCKVKWAKPACCTQESLYFKCDANLRIHRPRNSLFQ
jgi:hypothetical protein